MAAQDGKDFFISYNRHDRAWAEWIARQLEQAGYTTIIQSWDFAPGQNFPLKMHEALRTSKRTLLVLSPTYLTSEYTQPEWAATFVRDPQGLKGLLVPVKVRACQPDGLLAPLAHITLVGLEEEAARKELLDGIRPRLRPTGALSFPGPYAQKPQPLGFPGSWPVVWTVPFRPNPFFTGREELLKSLHAQLVSVQKVSLTQPLAIHGMGGIGKTQTAVEYAYRHQHEYQAVLWVRAAARDTLISDYATIASLLHLVGPSEQDQTRMVETVRQWLNRQQDWLLILDNADDLTIIPDFLPTNGHGHLLLTSRDPAIEAIAQSIEVQKMDEQEGIRLLLQRAHVLPTDAPLQQASEQDRALASRLVQEMGGLPLAIEQAGAYIDQTRCGLSRYLTLYQQHRADLFKWQPRIPSPYTRTVASTWELAFEQVEQRNPAVADLMRYCAFLDPDSIAEDLFTEGTSELSPALQTIVENDFQFNEALDLLRSFSLIRRLTDTQSISIHRLVQLVLRDRMDHATQKAWAERTVGLVDGAFPKVKFETWDRCKRYLPQVFICAELIEQYDIQTREAERLLHRGGWYLNEHARYKEGETLYLQALRIEEQVMGAEHLDTSATLNNLAMLYRDQKRYSEAEPLFQQSLRIKEQVLGDEQPETASTLDNLAGLYLRQGRYAEAEPLYQRALYIRERVQGAEHPNTGITLGNLALLYQEQGRYAEAEPLQQRALRIKEQALGAEHPETAITLHCLAHLYQTQRRYTEAEPLYKRALHIYEQALPVNHPYIAGLVGHYASLLRQMNRHQEAVQLEVRIRKNQSESH